MTEASPITPIRIEIIADITCPWCYIGKRRLEAAIAAYPNLDIDLHWRPFQLDPKIPEGGIDLQAYALERQNADEVIANQALASEAAKDVGLAFTWDKIVRMPNTRDAHRLIRLAAIYGVQTKMVERLFKAYFCEGMDIGNRSLLIELAEDSGLDSYAVENLFAKDEDFFSIEEELATTRCLNLPNLPFFVFADEIVVPGSASPQVFSAALFRAQAIGFDPGASLT